MRMNQRIPGVRAASPLRFFNRLPIPPAILLPGLLSLSILAPPGATAANLSQNPALNDAAAVSELVNAINHANSAGGAATINLFPNGVYTLSQAQNWEYGPNGLP